MNAPEPQKKLFVTKPFLPPLNEFRRYLEEIWRNQKVTNRGPFHERFEEALADYLGVKYISLFTNGTLALLTALQALRITGEVITTPYSFVATSHALNWNGIKPVFVDVEPDHLTLDPEKIEAAITPQTTAILAVHVYGYPCRMQQIQKIADAYGLKVIYDAAHAFGVKQGGQTILQFGDLAVLSFHGTKVFNTFEGGAIVSHDPVTKQRIDYLKNFGFANETTVVGPGINGKMNEFQAALGLLQLKYYEQVRQRRSEISRLYRQELEDVAGIELLTVPAFLEYNYSYFPIFVDADRLGIGRDELYQVLKENNIWGRRYFYPLISEFPVYRGLPSADGKNLPVALRASRRVICLPLYPDMEPDDVYRVTRTLKAVGAKTSVAVPVA